MIFKTRKTYYFYNPSTLKYERVYPSKREKLLVVARHLSIGVAIGVALFLLMIYNIPSPMESLIKKENKLLVTQYEILSLRLNEALDVLDEVQIRDEKLYRSIFQADSIPTSIRKSGFGGSNRYEHLMSLQNHELIVSASQRMDMLNKQLYIQSKSLDELIDMGKNQEDRLKCIPAIQPISNKDLSRTASGYGMRMDPIYRTRKFHAGMDFSAKKGTDIYATGNGRITYAGWKQGYGKCVIINHGYDYTTLYAHMNQFKVRVGQTVKRGEVIGEVGNTGKSTGPHLHYEVMINGRHDNPAKYYFMDLSPEEYDRMIQIAENHGQVMD
jgi:murein DD-endopeptidase MepM/ murein hydrolase activator NlpD